MHPDIKKFWENLGGNVWVQTKPDPALVSDVPAYWFDYEGINTRRLIAAPRGPNGELVYWINSEWKWVPEALALRLLKLKVFL